MVIKEEFPRPTVTHVTFGLHHGQKFEDGLQRTFVSLHDALADKLRSFEIPAQFKWHLNVSNLEIYSSPHKTYDLGNAKTFRDVIGWVLESFFALKPMTMIPSLFLRYRNLAPLPSKSDATLKSYYNSSFPIERFSIETAKEMRLDATIKRANYLFHYLECLVKENEAEKLLLVFEARAENVVAKDCMKVTDELHDMISDEFQKTIKQPIYDYMRGI